MGGRLGFGKALLVAATLHATAALVGWRCSSRAPARAENSASSREVAIELSSMESDPPATLAALAASGRAPSVEGAQGARVASVAKEAEGVSAHAGLEPTSALVGQPKEPPDEREAWSFSALVPGNRLGMEPGGATEAARNAVTESLGEVPADRADHPTQRAAASVSQALEEHDRALGLAWGGPLIEPTRDEVRQSLAPNVGSALFEFRTDGTGLVAGVRVLDADSDRKAWDEVARRLAQRTKQRPLRVPTGARGVAVTVRVESRVRLPSGHDAGETSWSVLGVPVKRSSAPHPMHFDIAAGGLAGLSGNVDPTDLLLDAKATPQRVVLAWVVSERPL